jgi:hypothetical protein
VEAESNFPRFTLFVGKEDSDKQILDRVVEKGRKLEESIKKKSDQIFAVKERRKRKE